MFFFIGFRISLLHHSFHLLIPAQLQDPTARAGIPSRVEGEVFSLVALHAVQCLRAADRQAIIHRNLMRLFSFAAAALWALALNATAEIIIIEPDAYAAGTILDHVVPQVNLFTVDHTDNWYLFDVTAQDDSSHYAPTGQRVFAAASVPFWNNDRRLRMDFNAPTTYVSIAFAGGDLFSTDVAELDAFDTTGTLLASYVTQPQAPGSVETMSISRPAGDIAWAVAYLPPGGGSFGRLDNLQFTVVPEPSTAALLLLAVTLFLRRR